MLVLVLAASSGCWFLAGAAIGGFGYAYYQGEARKTYSVSLDQASAASLSALASMNVTVVEKKDTEQGKYIQARRPDGTSVTVQLARVGEGTEIRIRVGLLGDEAYSQQILSAIEKNLKVK